MSGSRWTVLRWISVVTLVLLVGCQQQAEVRTWPVAGPEQSAAYVDEICVDIYTGHRGVGVSGTCRSCGLPNSSESYLLCFGCAEAEGRCFGCGKKADWRQRFDAEREMPLLLGILAHSADAKARRAAMRAIGQMNQPGGLEAVLPYRDDPSLWRPLSEEFEGLAASEHMDLLERILTEGTDEADPVDMTYIGTERVSFSAIAAAEAIAKTQTPEAYATLARLAREGTASQRVAALAAMQYTQDPRAEKLLVGVLKDIYGRGAGWVWGNGRGLRDAVLESLSVHGGPEAALAVLWSLKKCQRHAGHPELAQALSQLSCHAVDEIIEQVKQEKAAHPGLNTVRDELVQSLGASRSDRAESFLLQLLESDDQARYVAIGALGELKSTRAVGVLIGMLGDGEALSAVSALGQIGGEEAFDALVEMAGNPKTKRPQWAFSAMVNATFFGQGSDLQRRKTLQLAARMFTRDTYRSPLEPSVMGGWQDNYPAELYKQLVGLVLSAEDKQTFDGGWILLRQLVRRIPDVEFPQTPEARSEVARKVRLWNHRIRNRIGAGSFSPETPN